MSPTWRLTIYDAMVRLAQDFSMIPLVEGQGYGSMDGDSLCNEIQD